MQGRNFSQSDEALEQVAQRGGGCCVLGDIQGQAGPGSEQTDLAGSGCASFYELDSYSVWIELVSAVQITAYVYFEA